MALPIFGFVTVEFRWKSLVILSIITHHDYLRKGIGKQLIQKIKDISKERPEINVIRVDTGDFMYYAQQFYISCGFQICGYVSHDLSWSNHQVHFAYPLKGVEKEPSITTIERNLNIRKRYFNKENRI